MTVSINGSGAITFNDASTQSTAATGFGFKNRIINGAMMIDQRNAGASVSTGSGVSVYTVDRWAAIYSQTSKFTVQQNAGSVTPPAGFRNYAGITSSSAYSVGSTDFFLFRQAIEGFNVADLNWGTASAQSITISFWVRSSLTGTFGATIMNSAANRSYPFTYTISAANTWEQKVITIAGDTSGTWLSDNGVGLYLQFNLGTGSTYSGTAGAWTGTSNIFAPTGATSVVGTNGATFYITGVQLEKGSTATSFDYRPYGTELALCQRYYNKWAINSDGGGYTSFGSGYVSATTNANNNVAYPVQMRATPTFAQSNCAVLESGGAFAVTGFSVTYAGQESAMLSCTVASGLTAGRGAVLCGNNNVSAYLTASAEL